MKNYANKIKFLILTHKVTSGVLILMILLGGYYGYKKFTSTAGETRYVIAKVERGRIIASVSGSGQVTDVNQIDIKAKVSGDVVYLGAINGQTVKTGSLILEIDPTDAQKAVRDAQLSLDTAKLALQKLKIENSNENLDADSVKAYSDGFNSVSNAFIDLPEVINGLENDLAVNDLSSNAARISGTTATTYRQNAEDSYYVAKNLFDGGKKIYRTLNNNSSSSEIEGIVTKTYEIIKSTSSAVKSMTDFVNYMADDSNDYSAFSSYQASLATYANTIDTDLSDLFNIAVAIKSSKDSFQNANLDIQSAEYTVKQKENTLQDAKDNLADYFIRAPYDGIVANLDIKKFESVSSGTVIGAVVTKEQIALISLNEVDVAKIKVGEEVALTFDAVPELTIDGTVTEINSVGVINQGVVTYDVKINLNKEDTRVKPSMSVEALITTDKKEGVLMVPNGAIKSQGERNYVDIFDTPLSAPTSGAIGSVATTSPKRIPVEIGIANDTHTEIVSGLSEGQEIVVRTILGTATTTTASAPSLFGSPARTTTGGARNGTTRGN